MAHIINKIVTTREASGILKTSPGKIRQLALRKQIAAVKIGRSWVVYKPSLTWYRLGLYTSRRNRKRGAQLVARPNNSTSPRGDSIRNVHRAREVAQRRRH